MGGFSLRGTQVSPKLIEAAKKVPIEELLFSKAWAYRCEHEYRLISETKQYLKFEYDWIKSISITVNMPEEFFNISIKSLKTNTEYQSFIPILKRIIDKITTFMLYLPCGYNS